MTEFEDLPLCFTEGATAATVPEEARRGLSEVEAARLLGVHGRNELPEDEVPPVWRIVLGAFKEPMFALLAVCALLYLVVGDHDEAVMLGSFVVFVVGVTVVQERRTATALASLRGLAPPRALVVRGGRARRIEAALLVPGDVVCVAEGDHVPADAALVAACGLAVDESLITGESVPVHKAAPDGRVLSGTAVVSGAALCRVEATGAATQIGVIGASIAALGDERTPLDREVALLVRRMGAVAGVACALVFVAYGASRGDWTRAALTALSLAMGLLPEEFPVVLTVFVTIGALRMSYRRVLVRRNKAVEALSCCDVVCTDKTGTLTTSTMAVHTVTSATGDALVLEGASASLPAGPFRAVLEAAALAGNVAHDPIHAAVLAALGTGAGNGTGAEACAPREGWALVREYPFTREERMATYVWDTCPGATERDGRSASRFVAACKGAPEAVLPLCVNVAPGTAQAAAVLRAAAALADRGLRVLAVARTPAAHADADADAPPLAPSAAQLPARQTEFALELVGLVALVNPLRAVARSVVADMQAAGIRVVMITGDAPGTARFIADECGIAGAAATAAPVGSGCGAADSAGEGVVVTGSEIDRMGVEALARSADGCAVFARVLPQHKLAIVQALKRGGHVVSMIGDGVNDAPALKAAHVGVAMGQRGTEVAREAADLVLLDDDLEALTQAVRLGRRIRDNMVKAMTFIIAVHVPLCLMVVLPVLLGWPTVFYPAHIVCMELIIDPTCSVVLEAEPEEEDVMRRPPTRPDAHLVTARSLALALLQGLAVVATALGLHHVLMHRALHAGLGVEYANACTFCTVVVASLGLVVVNRSPTKTLLHSYRRRNVPLVVLIAVVALVLTAMFHSPRIARVMHFRVVHGHHLFHAVVWGIASVAWYEVYKYFKYERHAPQDASSSSSDAAGASSSSASSASSAELPALSELVAHLGARISTWVRSAVASLYPLARASSSSSSSGRSGHWDDVDLVTLEEGRSSRHFQ